MYENSDTRPIDLETMIGSRIAAIRDSRRPRLSQADVLERLADLGVSMSRQTLIRLEKGGRAGGRPITVRELLALAVALDVPPASLVAPVETAQTVAVTDGWGTTARALYTWLVGLTSPLHVDQDEPGNRRGIEYNPWNYGGITAMHDAYLRLHVYRRDFGDALMRVRTLEVERDTDGLPEPPDGTLEDAKRQLAVWGRAYGQAIHKAHAAGIEPPPMARDVVLMVAACVGRRDDVDVWMQELGIELLTEDEA